MPNPYQRGTDLLNCPKDCQWILIRRMLSAKIFWEYPCETWSFGCSADVNCACPREEAEKVVGVDCASGSDYGAIIIAHRDADGVLTIDSAEITPKERTNG